MYPYWYWIVITICVLFSMFFSAADMAYSVVNHEKLEKEAQNGNKCAKIAYDLATDYEFSISTILFGNNVVNILASALITFIGAAVAGATWGATVATIIFTAFLILFSEFLPKSIAKRFNYSLSKIFAYPVLFFKYLFFIFVWPISKLFIAFGKLFKKKSIEEDEIDEDVLTEMVDTIEEKGVLDEDEAELVRSAIDINDTKAFEIMTPRVDVFALDVNEDDLQKLIDDGEIFQYSRIPIYEDTIDNIIGILPIKAIARKRLNDEEVNIRELCYKPLVVPHSYPVIDLLEEFKKSKIHLAVVIDEYGGTEGIITMEDILEEIVGDIFDESDEIEEEYSELKDGVYIVDGSMNIDDFFDLIEYEKEYETDVSTVGGLVQETLERFAKVGDKFIFEEEYECEVLEIDEYTVEKLKVTKIKKEED